MGQRVSVLYSDVHVGSLFRRRVFGIKEKFLGASDPGVGITWLVSIQREKLSRIDGEFF